MKNLNIQDPDDLRELLMAIGADMRTLSDRISARTAAFLTINIVMIIFMITLALR